MLFGSIARAARCDFAAVTACNMQRSSQKKRARSTNPASRGQATFSVPNFVKKSFTCGHRSHRVGFRGSPVQAAMVHLSPRSRSTCSAQSSMLYSIGGFSESPNLRKWWSPRNLQRQKTRQSWFLSKPTQDKVRR